MLFNLLAMVGYLIVILIPAWQAVILGSFLFISWTAISLPATMELVATVLPMNRRTMGVSMHSLVRRIPMASVQCSAVRPLDCSARSTASGWRSAQPWPWRVSRWSCSGH
jgi:hypothetical protein